MKNFIQRGDTVTMAAPYDVESGGGCQVGALFGVAQAAALTGEEVELRLTGVVSLPKASGAVTQGAPLFWDDAERKLATSGTMRVGVAVVAAASLDGDVAVRLNASF